jgi:hypothetical protein
VVGLPFGRFFGVEMAATGVGLTGIMLGVGGHEGPGAAMFWGGASALVGARIWEVVDLVKRTDPRYR